MRPADEYEAQALRALNDAEDARNDYQSMLALAQVFATLAVAAAQEASR